MLSQRLTAVLAVVFAVAGAAPATAQIDYRNLDDHRPVRTEDAYTIERYAFEFMLPYEYEQADGGWQHVVSPEISYGAFRNTQIGLKLPLAAAGYNGVTQWGIGGPRVFGFYNLNTETKWPALAFRADVSIPAGDFAGTSLQVTLKSMMTSNLGLTRVHLNGLATLGSSGSPEVDAEPEWALTFAADRTLYRQSLLLVGEISLLRSTPASATEVAVAGGARYQLTPTVVLDLGAVRRLTTEGPDLGLTVGLSHAFAIASFMPTAGR